MARSGVVLSLIDLNALLSAETGAEALPPQLIPASVSAAKAFAALPGTDRTAPDDPAAALAKGGLRNMFYTKLKNILLALAALASLGSLTGLVMLSMWSL